jgi:hypothetical protein
MPTEGIAEGLVQEVLYSQDPAQIYGTVSELLYSYEPAQIDNAVGEVLWAFDPPNIHNVLFEVITSSTLFAVGGADRSVSIGAQVTLDGSASVNAVSYLWELTSKPVGSSLTIGSLGTTASVNFTPDVGGTYITKLTATSASSETDVDLVSIGAVFPAKGQVNFATIIHGIVASAKAEVNFCTVIHGPPPILPAQAEVNFCTIVHGIVNSAKAEVNFCTIVHNDIPIRRRRRRRRKPRRGGRGFFTTNINSSGNGFD